MSKEEFEYKVALLVQALENGLEENAKIEKTCIYPDCDNCGECYFREALRLSEEIRSVVLQGPKEQVIDIAEEQLTDLINGLIKFNNSFLLHVNKEKEGLNDKNF